MRVFSTPGDPDSGQMSMANPSCTAQANAPLQQDVFKNINRREVFVFSLMILRLLCSNADLFCCLSNRIILFAYAMTYSEGD
jgi:hypothetical protein